MVLELRKKPEIVPQYSLTGDLLSFMRCGLQYRYHNGSSLPPSRPVQLWFGEFIHGVMEAAFRTWRHSRPAFPWPCTPTDYMQPSPTGRVPHDVGELGDTVEETLRAQGKTARSAATRDSAYERARAAINDVGPHLFPLIAAAEEKVIGTRPIAKVPGLRADRYELHGIIDVLTDVELGAAAAGNAIVDAISAACALSGHYEVIVDYKGSRRPAQTDDYWKQGEWQVQTYAWLRMKQATAKQVVAGALLYVNELAPGSSDMEELKRQVAKGITDVVPTPGTSDAYQMNTWKPGAAVPTFSTAFRLRRALRIIPVTPASQAFATGEFDKVVADIEACISKEETGNTIDGQWSPRGDEETCAACDFRHFCPNPHPHKGLRKPPSPTAP
jgi:hypothetical protein